MEINRIKSSTLDEIDPNLKSGISYISDILFKINPPGFYTY